jgi:outer membrane immunogenic protein
MKEDQMRNHFMCAVVAAAVAGPAVAADVAVRPQYQQPVVAPAPYVPDWAGFYVGIHGGGGWAHESVDPSLNEFDDFGTFGPFPTPPGVNANGGVFGFQVGHNWQWGPVVGGLEIDFSGANLKKSTAWGGLEFGDPAFPFTATHELKIDELASARGRLGYLMWPNILAYGTAGIGWTHFRTFNSVTDIEGGDHFTDTMTSNSNAFGWVAGVGVEWKFAERWFLRGEWLHYDFGKVTAANNNSFMLGDFSVDTGTSRLTVDVARAALSYRFGP